MASEEDPAARQIPIEGVPLVYVNWLRTVGTVGDLALDVGYQPPNLPPQPAVRLVMSWEHAKLLGESLRTAVENFEKDNDTVRDLKQHLIRGTDG